MDGYAFAWDDALGESPDLPLQPGRAAAGHPFEGAVPAGHAVRILTGAELPDCADTVVLQEDAEVAAGRVQFARPRKKGANCRPRGEDARAGEIALDAGRRLGAADLARLAVAGVSEVPVRQPLRVGILSTGDELIQPGESGPGIYDANRPMLTALVHDLGHVPVDLGTMPDQVKAIRAALDRGAAGSDAILTTGGASAGDEDHIFAAFCARKDGSRPGGLP